MLTVYSLNPDKRLSVTIAVFFAEDVLPIWEVENPHDMRPRKAIEAAKAWLVSPCKKTADAAVASYASYASSFANVTAFYAAAAASSDAAAYAACYAADAADAAADATFIHRSDRKLYIHSKLVQLLPHLFEYKVFTKTSFKDPEQVFDLLSKQNQQRFLFNLNHLR